MKLRIRGNSIRLRLTQGEVAQLADEGRVEDATDFGGGVKLNYVLQLDDTRDIVSTTFADATITVSVPDAVADTWCTTDQVGFGNVQDLGKIGRAHV